ncbi:MULTISPECIES: M16 family metallopeptidase [unclassified Tolypothrix]|uniref:M16 family metallopeptidase n=1 Tax=unclassified Tolypothrix TaxID=2649714 RepID=UPI0005EAB55F|nr:MULTISPECIES: pitrilysin family protein [unclassified Tolypothrix]BAY93549.1 peptidase M16 domain-containing protein [Microchaete diplosiphon NIES-3275]EKE99495.1 peptidase M16 inactive domain protein [Tolypothrix sp. PCC 7601]MBE9085971.1 insulinase family protein [Tolypothrix sp. LEGE 11397]UYD29811.1 insulinase family protein [Tolypothrix sp. PCC 7712]UYD37749.1 insulinase family protein [Tolypothrix sp. PCC 7601]
MFPASVFHLDNGLTFIHQQIPTTPVVVADVWVRAGATLEPEPWFGMAHFLEHMIFKGTESLPPGVFDYNIENKGGVSNAATSYDYAHYSLTTAAPYLHETLPHLSELLLNAAIPDHEFIRERDVVLEEIRSYHDDPDWLGFQALIQTVYHKHPYGRSVLGTEKQLMQQSPAAMRCFHRAHYQPENMTVVIVGGMNQQSALDLVNCSFGNFAQRSDCPLVEKSQNPIIEGIKRQELTLPRLEQARLMMAWLAPGVEQLRTAYGLDLLSVLLAEGRTSRLVRDLREELQLVQGICSNFSLQRESSLFTITAWLEPEHLEKVEFLIRAHLEDLQNQPISQHELDRTRRLLCNEYAFSTETPNQLTGLYGYYNTIARAELAVTYPQQVLSFDAQELQQLAKQYLSPHNYAVTILKPC